MLRFLVTYQVFWVRLEMWLPKLIWGMNQAVLLFLGVVTWLCPLIFLMLTDKLQEFFYLAFPLHFVSNVAFHGQWSGLVLPLAFCQAGWHPTLPPICQRLGGLSGKAEICSAQLPRCWTVVPGALMPRAVTNCFTTVSFSWGSPSGCAHFTRNWAKQKDLRCSDC